MERCDLKTYPKWYYAGMGKAETMKAMYGGFDSASRADSSVIDFKCTKTGRSSFQGQKASFLVIDDLGGFPEWKDMTSDDAADAIRHSIGYARQEGKNAPLDPPPPTMRGHAKWKNIKGRDSVALITSVFKNPNPLARPGECSRGKPWRDDHRRVLTIMWGHNYNLGEIAYALGRSIGAISAQLSNLGLVSRDIDNDPEIYRKNTYTSTSKPWD
jgi:hypothetical protein